MHNLCYKDYDGSKSIAEIEKDIIAIVSSSGDGYGTSSIKEIPGVCDTKNEAFSELAKYIDFYGGYAIRYRDPAAMQKSKVPELMKKRTALQTERAEYMLANAVLKGKSEYISCKQCGSKLKRKLIVGNYCPLCGADLSVKAVRDKVARYDIKIKKVEDSIADNIKKNAKRQREAKTLWLVRYEYHS